METKGSSIIEEYLRGIYQEIGDPDSIYEKVNILALSEE